MNRIKTGALAVTDNFILPLRIDSLRVVDYLTETV